MTETAFIPFSATASTGNQPTRVSLSPGGSWASYEQFRLSGSSGLVAGVAESQVGFLNVKGVEFAILRRRDFERLFALATDALRLMRGVPLFRSAGDV